MKLQRWLGLLVVLSSVGIFFSAGLLEGDLADALVGQSAAVRSGDDGSAEFVAVAVLCVTLLVLGVILIARPAGPPVPEGQDMALER